MMAVKLNGTAYDRAGPDRACRTWLMTGDAGASTSPLGPARERIHRAARGIASTQGGGISGLRRAGTEKDEGTATSSHTATSRTSTCGLWRRNACRESKDYDANSRWLTYMAGGSY